MARSWWGVLLIGGLLALLTGCGDSNIYSGDDSTDEAKLDRALMAMDDGDWDNSIALLEQLDQNDPEVQKYLASAYVGKTGFDTLELITIVAEYEENQNDDGEILFDSVTDLFAANGQIHAAAAKIANLELAIGHLTDPPATASAASDDLAKASSLSNRSRDRLVQRGTYAALQTVLIIVQMLDDSDPVIRQSLRGMSDGEIEARITQLKFDLAQEKLERNLNMVGAAVDVLPGEENELKSQFDKFLTRIGFDDGSLSRDDLVAYLKNVL